MKVIRVDHRMKNPQIYKFINEKNYICIQGFWKTAFSLYTYISSQLILKNKVDDFESYRTYKLHCFEYFKYVLLPLSYISSDSSSVFLSLKGSPWVSNDFLRIIQHSWYPATINDIHVFKRYRKNKHSLPPSYFIPLRKFLGINSSFQWYKTGVKYPFLDHKLYPRYCYFPPPTQCKHIETFDSLLNSRLLTNVNSVMDVGTGSGIISFLFIKNGFNPIYATDININSIISVSEELNRNHWNNRITLLHHDLFYPGIKVDLIVFNPPWVPADHIPHDPLDLSTTLPNINLYHNDSIDQSIFYPPDLFSRFFNGASRHLNPRGYLIVFYSNFSFLINRSHQGQHPIELELKKGRYRYINCLKIAPSPLSSTEVLKKPWMNNIRKYELMEIWILQSI